jgi:hypothetical protein
MERGIGKEQRLGGNSIIQKEGIFKIIENGQEVGQMEEQEAEPTGFRGLSRIGSQGKGQRILLELQLT